MVIKWLDNNGVRADYNWYPGGNTPPYYIRHVDVPCMQCRKSDGFDMYTYRYAMNLCRMHASELGIIW